jgi:hypothetical protein
MARALDPYLPPDITGAKPGAVEVTFRRHGLRYLDDDSCAYAHKTLRDQCAHWLGCKDSPKDPPVWRYEQARHVEMEPDRRRGKQGHQRYVIFVTVRIRTVGEPLAP